MKRLAALLPRLLLALALCAQAASAQDYLPEALRAQVDALAADARRAPSTPANAAARARTLWKWLNAYALTGRHMPVDAAAAVAAALAEPRAQDGIRRLDPAIAALALLDRQPDAIGTLAADAGPLRAGGFATIRQVYTAGARGIEPGGGFVVVRPDLPGLGRYQTEDAAADNYVSISASNPSVRFARAAPPFGATTGTLMFRITSGRLGPGDAATIVYGDAGGGGRGLRMTDAATARLPLPLHVVFEAGGAPIGLPIQPIGVVGAAVAGVRGFAPSVVATGEAFALSVRAEDAHRNRASGPIPAWEIAANGVAFREIPAGGEALVVLAGIRFTEPGVYRIGIRSRDGAIAGYANPVLVEDAPQRRIYWGDTRARSGFAEGFGDLDAFMDWARDDARLDFVAHAEADTHLDDREWNMLRAAVRRHSEAGRFVAFLGYQWAAGTPAGGRHGVLFRTADGRRRVPSQEAGTLSALYHGLRRSADPRDVAVIAQAQQAGDYRLHDPLLQSLVEVRSEHGTFEWFARAYLQQGHHVGFLAASGNRLGHPGYSAPSGGALRQRGGLGALRARELTRDALFDAMKSRSAYATSGERIIVDAALNGVAMGGRAPFARQRRIAGRIIGTAPIESIAIVRNGVDIWRRDYSAAAPARPLADGEFLLTFASPSAPFHPGDNPRGWRAWRGTIEVSGATLAAARAASPLATSTRIAAAGTSAIGFESFTRGGGSSLRLTLSDIRRGARLTVRLDAADEFGEAPPHFRPHGRLPAATAVLELRHLADGAARQDLAEGGFADTVTLRRIAPRGEMDVRFSHVDAGTRQGDSYYIRVRQTDDAMAWSSPILVGGHPSR